MYYVRIPKERVGVLIGRGGEVKREIEGRTNTKLSVEDTSVSIDGEGLDAWRAQDVVLAVGRGFSPEHAFILFDEQYILEVMQLSDYASTQKSMTRLKGRVIGEKGKTRRFIEKSTGSLVSVYGKTIAIIGSYDSVARARGAVSMLLSGSQHSTVRRFLERKRSCR